jgi:hypothetical protein
LCAKRMEQTYRRCAAPGRRSGRRRPGAPPRRGTPEAPAGGLAKTPIHPNLPRSLLTPFPPPHPTPHPSFPPQPLGPALSGRRASAPLGPGAGSPARRRCGGAGSLRVSPPKPRARVVRYAGSKIFQRNVIVPLHEQHISLRRILIALQLRATSLIPAL